MRNVLAHNQVSARRFIERFKTAFTTRSDGLHLAEMEPIISLHGLRIFLEESYEMIIDRLEVMPPILEVVALRRTIYAPIDVE